jgi:hypothetical protein
MENFKYVIQDGFKYLVFKNEDEAEEYAYHHPLDDNHAYHYVCLNGYYNALTIVPENNGQ